MRGLRRAGPWGQGFPFAVPAVADVSALRLDAPVTLLAGDNGSGKSTLIEAIAEAIGFDAQGGELERLGELPAVPRAVLGGALEPELTDTKPRIGYFLRAESFFNVAAFVDSQGTFSPDLSLYGDVPLHEQSHGESFLALAANRFGADSLYVLDEPEAALSLTSALAFLAVMDRAAKAGSQFIVATHSPVLLALPGARVYELSDTGVDEVEWDLTETVSLMKAFLNAPERFVRQALG